MVYSSHGLWLHLHLVVFVAYRYVDYLMKFPTVFLLAYDQQKMVVYIIAMVYAVRAGYPVIVDLGL